MRRLHRFSSTPFCRLDGLQRVSGRLALAFGVSLLALGLPILTPTPAMAQGDFAVDVTDPNISVDLSVLDDGGLASQYGQPMGMPGAASMRSGGGSAVPDAKLPVSQLYVQPSADVALPPPTKTLIAKPKPPVVEPTEPTVADTPLDEPVHEADLPDAMPEDTVAEPIVPPAPELGEPTSQADAAPQTPESVTAETQIAPETQPAAQPQAEAQAEPQAQPQAVAETQPAPAPQTPSAPESQPGTVAETQPAPSAEPVTPSAQPTEPVAVAETQAPVAETPAGDIPPPPQALPTEPVEATPQAQPQQPVSGGVVVALPPRPEELQPGVASLPPSSGPLSDGDNMRIIFEPDSSKLPADAREALKTLADRLAAQDALRLQLLAYAGDTETSASAARRLSLSRALAVRSFLIESGVRSTRIDVRALGNKSTDNVTERVDITVVER